MEQAARKFGGNDGVFNAACFSNRMMTLAGLSGVMDGMLVRAVLSGRGDVEVLRGGHYRLMPGDRE